ncbi:MAG: ankyrin repeat domain-containing protein [Nitrososphaeraceae archaeon]|nr:ankyrin repeat domain-containing protein [Nitrososphaeraceae archaeon]
MDFFTSGQKLDAIRGDDFNFIKALIESGVDINIYDHWGNTFLLTALLHNKPEFVKWLVINGADVNVPTENTSLSTPLFWAIIKNQTDIVQYLLDSGANPFISIHTIDSKIITLIMEAQAQFKRKHQTLQQRCWAICQSEHLDTSIIPQYIINNNINNIL